MVVIVIVVMTENKIAIDRIALGIDELDMMQEPVERL
jgi:hypothetical protein